MSHPTRRRWYVEDGIAEQRLTGLDAAAEGIRLDRPGWRDVRRARGVVAGLVVGTGQRPFDLAAAMADLAGNDEVVMALPADGLGDVDWVGPCAAWRLVDGPHAADGTVSLTLAPAGPGPTLATVAALHHRRAPVPASRQPAPWRLRLVDAPARTWFGDLATASDRAALVVAGTAVATADADAPVVGEDDRAARRLVVAGDGATAVPDAVVVTDDPVAAGDGIRVVARPVDLRRFSPVGCSPRAAAAAPVLPISADGRADELADARAAAAGVAEACVAAGARSDPTVDEVAVTGDGTPTGRDLARLRDAVVLLDHPAGHAGPAAHARWLLAAIASGVPVLPLAPLPGPVAGLLGDVVVATLASVTPDDVADPDLRERASVLQRRAVLAQHTSAARLRQLADDLGLLAPRPRSVTIVMATNRERFLDHACRQIARQDWPRLEVVVVTHGARAPATVRQVVDAHLGDRPTTLRHVTEQWTLGDALNVGVELAGGELVTKFDDDDFYSPAHVTELVQALDHSAADVVGKAAEFVHLAQTSTTLRRWGRGGERYSATLAGGTLLFRRDVWRDLAGFPRVDLGEDRGIVEDVRAAGGTTYRCHPYGYLLQRHGQHAWSVDDQAFLDDAVATRPGPAHDWTLT